MHDIDVIPIMVQNTASSIGFIIIGTFIFIIIIVTILIVTKEITPELISKES